MVSCQPQPSSKPWQTAPPKASPAPRPLTTSIGDRRRRHHATTCEGGHTGRTHLDHRHLDSEIENAFGHLGGGALPDRYGTLLEIADGDGDPLERLALPLRSLVGMLPEHRPVVQVVNGDPGSVPDVEGAERCRSAGLVRQVRCRSSRKSGPPEWRRGRALRPADSCPALWALDRRARGIGRVDRSRKRRSESAGPDRCPRRTSSTPNPFKAALTYTPNPSSPTLVITAAECPYRAAATATLVAVPPRYLANVLTSARGHARLLRVEVDSHPAHCDQVVGSESARGCWNVPRARC